MAANVTVDGPDGFGNEFENVTSATPVLNVDNIANISATAFFCIFLCCFGYFMYWLQDRQERKARVRMALARNEDIDRRRDFNSTKSSHGAGGEVVRGSTVTVTDSRTVQQVNISNQATVPISYNDHISVTLSAPIYTPIGKDTGRSDRNSSSDPGPLSPISRVNEKGEHTTVEFKSVSKFVSEPSGSPYQLLPNEGHQ